MHFRTSIQTIIGLIFNNLLYIKVIVYRDNWLSGYCHHPDLCGPKDKDMHINVNEKKKMNETFQKCKIMNVEHRPEYGSRRSPDSSHLGSISETRSDLSHSPWGEMPYQLSMRAVSVWGYSPASLITTEAATASASQSGPSYTDEVKFRSSRFTSSWRSFMSFSFSKG